MVTLDTETCGLHGIIVLIQYAEDDGPIKLWDVWLNPIGETLQLISWLCEQEIVGFNLAFDWFHINKLYNVFLLLAERYGYDILPEDYIDEAGELEADARDGLCLKPKACRDLFLIARKTKYQSLMEREDIRIKRVPTLLAERLAEKLTERIPFSDVYFARKENKKKRWEVLDVKDQVGDTVKDFKDIVLRFAPSSALKALAVDAGIVDEESVLRFGDVNVHKKFVPTEYGFAPFATAPIFTKSGGVINPDRSNWHMRWPAVIEHHITHWGYNKLARKYAEDDIVYTRGIDKFFNCTDFKDTDSQLACMVGAVRWKGYKVDLTYIRKLIEDQKAIIAGAQIRGGSTEACKQYLFEVMTEQERFTMLHNDKYCTKGIILEEIARWRIADVCPDCMGAGCNLCTDGLRNTEEWHPAALRAQEILDVRHAAKEIELYEKLLIAGRFHASFKVIGALSGRMSGGDGLNPQGIKRSEKVRKAFPLAFSGEHCCGGDFAGFEVVIMDARYADPELRKMLLSGKKIHGIFGVFFFPPMTYEEIMDTKGLPNELDKYTRSKNGVFALCYGGEAYTLTTRVGIDPAVAEHAFQNIMNRFPVMGEKRRETIARFSTITQPGGLKTRIYYNKPADYVESMFGFKRYFTLENKIVDELFTLAQDPPEEWRGLPIKVVRRDREQTVAGACASALYGACFGIMGANSRAAVNHEIQSTGAEMTKELENDIWKLQPSGIHEWHVRPMNVHDEILVVNKPGLEIEVHKIVDSYILKMRPQIPLLEIDWKDKLNDWSEK